MAVTTCPHCHRKVRLSPLSRRVLRQCGLCGQGFRLSRFTIVQYNAMQTSALLPAVSGLATDSVAVAVLIIVAHVHKGTVLYGLWDARYRAVQSEVGQKVACGRE